MQADSYLCRLAAVGLLMLSLEASNCGVHCQGVPSLQYTIQAESTRSTSLSSCSYDAELDEHMCLATNGTKMTVPCGKYEEDGRHSFTYYVPHFSGKQTVIAAGLNHFLQMAVTVEDNGKYVCCQPNLMMEPVCYKMDVLYQPVAMELEWCEGMQPTLGHRYCMMCPLDGNPSAHYYWERYRYPDCSEAMELPHDLVFSDNGKKWSVDSYTEEHNGMYVCHAANSVGSAIFNNQAFFMSAQGCDNLSGNPTVHVASTGEHRLIPNSNVTVTCTAAPSSSILPLSWWMVAQNNSFQALHGHPGYIVKSGYDKLHCRWTSLLTITNFSAELAGEYMCSVGLSHDAVKLQMGACYLHDEQDTFIEIAQYNSQPLQGDNVTLHCRALNVSRNALLRWGLPDEMPCTNHSSPKLCGYSVSQSYSEENCLWTSSLTIHNFSKVLVGTYTCSVNGQSGNITLKLTELGAMSLTTQTVVLIFSAVIAALISALAAMYWWKTISWNDTKEPPYDGFKYDVFISAHHEVKQTVQERIMAPLETVCQPSYRICWHERNFEVGVPIMEQIADAVEQSRKVLFVFSENFMQSSFCQFELDLALHRLLTSRTRCLVPIALSETAVPRKLKRQVTYLPWADPSKDNFVNKVTNLIGRPMR